MGGKLAAILVHDWARKPNVQVPLWAYAFEDIYPPERRQALANAPRIESIQIPLKRQLLPTTPEVQESV